MTYLLAAILGLVFGSFISMLTYRLPQVYQENALKQWKAISLSRSKCPNCSTPLPAQQLIPVFSWLISLGKCHNCKNPISLGYPIIESLSALLVLLAVYKFGCSYTALFASFFLLSLLTISIIDIDHFLILDGLSYPLILSGLIVNFFGTLTGFTDALLGATLGYLGFALVAYIHTKATGKVGMGEGDFKLFAALGAWLGLSALPQILFISAGLALVFALVFIILKKQSKAGKIPFAPYLSFAGFIGLFFGNDFIIEQISQLI